MKKNKLLLLIGATLGLSYQGVAIAATSQIDTEHQDIIIGTISSEELEKEHDQFLEAHPEYKNQWNITRISNEPLNIQFIKLAPNPNYVPSTKKDIELKAVSYPPSRMLNLFTPPLDQGNFGTCVTFGVLGAYAAGIQMANSPVSPSASCLLQLIKTKGENAWDGYWVQNMASTLKTDGWITEINAKSGFCHQTYTTYQPRGSNDQKNATLISINNYRATSTKLTSNYHEQSFSNADTALNYIKQELNDTSIGPVRGTPGWYPVFSFHHPYMPNAEINLNDGRFPVWADDGSPLDRTKGHAAFAYGYDDNIVVNNQQGVLYLRNSWGYLGNNGNYLMTYSFFRKNYQTSGHILSFPNSNRKTNGIGQSKLEEEI